MNYLLFFQNTVDVNAINETLSLFMPMIWNVFWVIVVLVAGWIAARWISARVYTILEGSGKVDDTLVPFIAKTLRVLVLVVVLIAVLSHFGFETTSLVALLGAAGLTIGLAMQGTLSNVASGVMLLSFRPFEAGDFVSVGGTMGVVDEIGLFITKMHTLDNIYMVLPNSAIWGKEIKNFSRNETRRVDMVFSIGYNDDIDKAIKLINEELAAEERVLKEPEPLVAVGELGDSSVDLLVRPWTLRTDFWMTRLDLTRKIKQRFDREGVTIPFPQRDVHLYETGKTNGKKTASPQ